MIDPAWKINMTKGFNPESGGYGSSSYLNQGIPLHFTPTQFAIAPSSDFIALFRNVTASNNAHNDSGGGWRTMGYGGWTRETEWTRHMVLTAEGALIVADSLKTSEMDGGWLGGPLWQMVSQSCATLTTGRVAGQCAMGAFWANLPIFSPFSPKRHSS